jgi:predicted nucleic acid-binding protein
MGTTLVDSSVLIALLDPADAHHEEARRALVEAEDRGPLVAPAVVYGELLTGALLQGGRTVEVIESLFGDRVGVEPMTREVAATAARIRVAAGLRLIDAAIVATGVELGADEILTADRRWRRADPRVRVIGSRSR